MLATLSILFVYLLVFLLSFSGMTLVIWIMARLLMLIFPFSLFEAMLLSTFFSSFATYALMRFHGITEDVHGEIKEIEKSSTLHNHFRTARLSDIELDRSDFDRDDYKYISDTRFYKDSSERTWENWLRKEIANDIYAEFQQKSKAVSNLNDTQSQELAVRLAEFGVNILKRKTSRTRKLTITKNQLTREVEKNGQRAYDDMIIRLAVAAQNMNMGFYYDTLIEVVRNNQWNQQATIDDEA